MANGEENGKTDVGELVRQAEDATSHLDDPELRKTAFSIVLTHLLSGSMPKTDIDHTKPAERKARKTKTSTAASSIKSTEPTKSIKPGPLAWLRELADEAYFSEPRNVAQILEALAERGHTLKPNDITWQLKALMDQKVLRRQKKAPEEGGKAVWHYVNWG